MVVRGFVHGLAAREARECDCGRHAGRESERERQAYLRGDAKGEPDMVPDVTRPPPARFTCATRGIMIRIVVRRDAVGMLLIEASRVLVG